MPIDMIRCPGCGVIMDLSTFEPRPEQVVCPVCDTMSMVPAPMPTVTPSPVARSVTPSDIVYRHYENPSAAEPVQGAYSKDSVAQSGPKHAKEPSFEPASSQEFQLQRDYDGQAVFAAPFAQNPAAPSNLPSSQPSFPAMSSDEQFAQAAATYGARPAPAPAPYGVQAAPVQQDRIAQQPDYAWHMATTRQQDSAIGGQIPSYGMPFAEPPSSMPSTANVQADSFLPSGLQAGYQPVFERQPELQSQEKFDEFWNGLEGNADTGKGKSRKKGPVIATARSADTPKKARVLQIDAAGNAEGLAFAIIGLASSWLAFPPLGLGLCAAALMMNREEKAHGYVNQHATATTATAVAGIVVNALVLLAEILLLLMVASSPALLASYL